LFIKENFVYLRKQKPSIMKTIKAIRSHFNLPQAIFCSLVFAIFLFGLIHGPVN